MNTNYVKLSGVTEFLLEEIIGVEYFRWDEVTSKPQKSKEWFEGSSKKFILNTDKGQMTISTSQMGQILLACFNGQTSEPVGKSYTVKSNGKTGKDWRPFINLKKGEPYLKPQEEEVNIEGIPF